MLKTLRGRRWSPIERVLRASDRQQVYTALDLTSARPTLYVASAAGASVARVLEGISTGDPAVRVVDTHRLEPADPNGVDIFYLMLVTTLIGFLTVFQVRANAGGLVARDWSVFVIGLALAAALALSLVDGPLLDRLPLPVASGATVTSLRDAVYFPAYQHARRIVVLASWAVGLFAAMVLVAHRRGASPGGP